MYFVFKMFKTYICFVKIYNNFLSSSSYNNALKKNPKLFQHYSNKFFKNKLPNSFFTAIKTLMFTFDTKIFYQKIRSLKLFILLLY